LKQTHTDTLKGFGNTILGKFGLSLDNFKAEKDPDSGSYSIQFVQNPGVPAGGDATGGAPAHDATPQPPLASKPSQ
jgi:hypothetical protein